MSWRRTELPVLTLADADKLMDVRNELSDFVFAWRGGLNDEVTEKARAAISKILDLMDEVI